MATVGQAIQEIVAWLLHGPRQQQLSVALLLISLSLAIVNYTLVTGVANDFNTICKNTCPRLGYDSGQFVGAHCECAINNTDKIGDRIKVNWTI